MPIFWFISLYDWLCVFKILHNIMSPLYCAVKTPKAFDRINHDALINKLTTIGIPLAVVKWIAGFLLDREQRVKFVISHPKGIGANFTSQSSTRRNSPKVQ